MPEVTAQLGCAQGSHRKAVTNALFDADQLCVEQHLVQVLTTHQDDTRPAGFTCIEGRQCFQFGQGFGTQMTRVLNSDKNTSTLSFQLLKATSEEAELLDYAVGSFFGRELVEKELKDILALKSHSGEANGLALRAHGLQSAIDECRFAGADGSCNSDNRIVRRKRFLEACQNARSLRPDEYISPGRVGAKRTLFKSKLLFVHKLRSALVAAVYQ